MDIVRWPFRGMKARWVYDPQHREGYVKHIDWEHQIVTIDYGPKLPRRQVCFCDIEEILR